MGRGFECGDGWFDIIDRLSEQLEAHAHALLDAGATLTPEVAQVKEKFGELRFYMRRPDAAMDIWIAEAEQRAACTCEICGQPGQLRVAPRRQTLCTNHAGGV